MIAAIVCFFVVLCVCGWFFSVAVENAGAVVVLLLVFGGVIVFAQVKPDHAGSTEVTSAYRYNPARDCFELKTQQGTNDPACFKHLPPPAPDGSAAPHVAAADFAVFAASPEVKSAIATYGQLEVWSCWAGSDFWSCVRRLPPQHAVAAAADLPEVQHAIATYGLEPVRACFDTAKAQKGRDADFWACVDTLKPISG